MNISASTSALNVNQKDIAINKFCQNCSSKFNIFRHKVTIYINLISDTWFPGSKDEKYKTSFT